MNTKLLVCLAVCLLVALPARADEGWASRDYEFATRQMDDFMWRFQRDLVNPVSRGLRKRKAKARAAGAAGSERAAAAMTVPERVPQVPQAMAAAYPPAERARVEKTFRELLAAYRQLEQEYKLPPGDLAGAVAVFIGGAYMGYHNKEFPDEYFPPMVEQIRVILAANPAMASAPVAARQEMYEQLAITGMFMAIIQLGLQQQPDPQTEARMRAAGKGCLEQFLKIDADRVQITAQGLVLR